MFLQLPLQLFLWKEPIFRNYLCKILEEIIELGGISDNRTFMFSLPCLYYLGKRQVVQFRFNEDNYSYFLAFSVHLNPF